MEVPEQHAAAELLEALVQSLEDARSSRSGQPTSMRLPANVHRAAQLAIDMGMDESLTQATAAALLDRIRAFVRSAGLAEHFRRYPHDVPTLAEVAKRRVEGTDHPAAGRPDLVDQAAAWVEQRHDDWALTGQIDDAVDRVLEYVEMLAAGVGNPGRASA